MFWKKYGMLNALGAMHGRSFLDFCIIGQIGTFLIVKQTGVWKVKNKHVIFPNYQ